MTETDKKQMTGQIQERVDYYNSELLKNPDTAQKNTEKKYGIKKSQFYSQIAKYSQTPAQYKKNLRDAQTAANISADELIDKEFYDECGGVIDNPRLKNLTKNAERLGIDVKGEYNQLLQNLIRKKTITTETDDYMAVQMGKKIDDIIPKPLQQQVEERRYEADLREADLRMVQADSDMMGEGNVRTFHKWKGEALKRKEIATKGDGKTEDLYYNDKYMQKMNEALEIRRMAMNPNIPIEYIQSSRENFVIKWSLERAQENEKRQRKFAQSIQKELEEKEFTPIHKEHERIDYENQSTEQLYEQYIDMGGDPDNLIYN